MPWWVAPFFLLAIVLLPAALRWGGWPEQVIAAGNLAGAVLTRLAQPPGANFDEVVWSILLIDWAVFLTLLFVALRSDRWWPMLATALLAPSLFAHIARALNPALESNGYALAGMTAYLIPPVLIAGIYRQWRRFSAPVPH
ncbi:hypothetical protein [Sphingomonas dokdonensis]|uniref:hypothetical protein n=1 Tax=Sphingomonas dokdonensis TaxID=344880 RepID=UPI001303A428|nr:hypothetical protein [Sphingomonas dokdonensis]